MERPRQVSYRGQRELCQSASVNILSLPFNVYAPFDHRFTTRLPLLAQRNWTSRRQIPALSSPSLVARGKRRIVSRALDRSRGAQEGFKGLER